ncbi:hypothetical protein [Kluyvera genomosp. 1]|uniref:hypothetical protein n=1 Tax=Kluyvera genomosp. 1 TaxID=2774053 RepID=UPI00068DFF30|nr:hypothetical protein [Kluyvera genomosp. 1]
MEKTYQIEFDVADNHHLIKTVINVSDSDTENEVLGKIFRAMTKEAAKHYDLNTHHGGAFHSIKIFDISEQ